MDATITIFKDTEQENNSSAFKRRTITVPEFTLIMLSEILCGLIVLVFLTGCSALNIETAKKLGAAGQAVSLQSAAGIFVSEENYQLAMDSEAFFHGFTGMDTPAQLIENYEVIQTELSSRRTVFKRLDEVYGQFGVLASIDAATGFETSIQGLGDAINGYALTRGTDAVISAPVQGGIAQIGGLTAAEVQRKKIQKSSMMVRERLTEFLALFDNPIVRIQFTSFKENLVANRTSAIRLLWKKGAFDPSPLINQMGEDAGLKASKESLKMINDPKDKAVRNGLEKVIERRLVRKMNLIERNYDSSIRAVRELIAKHKKLEAGEKLDLARLRQIIGDTQRVNGLLQYD